MHTYSDSKTIDCTPSWSAMVSVILALLQDGNEEGKKVAKEQMKHMAVVADMWVTIQPKFPNGFEEWHETHFVVTQYITETTDIPNTMAAKAMETSGTGGLYELAEELTCEFENLYRGVNWGEENKYYHDILESWLKAKDLQQV